MKTSKSAAQPTIVSLAERIQEDIAQKRLSPGAPYLKLSETARMLGVSNGSANRALQLLEQRGILSRKQRRGTFVSGLPEPTGDAIIDRIHVITHKEFLKEGFLADGQILGLQGELPKAELIFNFLPELDDGAFVQDLVNEALASSGVDAFVLISSSLMAQRTMAASGLPAVVGGSLYPSVSGLSWVDCDHRQMAQKCVRHLAGGGCRQFLIAMRDHSLPGDEAFLDALWQEFCRRETAMRDVMIMHLPGDTEAVKAAAWNALRTLGNSVGIIARSEILADGVAAAIDDLGTKKRTQRQVVISQIHRVRPDLHPTFPYFQMSCSAQERGEKYGELLRRFVQKMTPIGIQFPVEMVRNET